MEAMLTAAGSGFGFVVPPIPKGEQQSDDSSIPQQIVIPTRKGSTAFLKMAKNAESTRAFLQKTKEEQNYAEKERQLFSLFQDYKHTDTQAIPQNEQTEDSIKMRRELDELILHNSLKHAELKQLKRKLINKHQISNSIITNDIFDDMRGISQFEESSRMGQRISQQGFHSIQSSTFSKMKKSINNISMLSMKQESNPNEISAVVGTLQDNQLKVSELIENQLETQNQLLKKVDEIKISLDKILKEKNEVENINQLFEKKFTNLELREINAQKKYEAASFGMAHFEKELEDLRSKGLFNLQDKQQEKSNIYAEVKHLKHEMTLRLVQIEEKKQIAEEQQEDIEQLEQREKELFEKLKESQYIVRYIHTLEILQRIFCSNNPEGEINNYDDRELNDDFLLLGGSKNDEEIRSIAVKKLDEFLEKNQEGADQIVSNLIVQFEKLQMDSQSLHSRYNQLMDVKKTMNSELKVIQEKIDQRKEEEIRLHNLMNFQDLTEDVAPEWSHTKMKDWVGNNQIVEIIKKKVDSNIILEVKSASNIDEDDNSSDDSLLERDQQKGVIRSMAMLDERAEEQRNEECNQSNQLKVIFEQGRAASGEQKKIERNQQLGQTEEIHVGEDILKIKNNSMEDSTLLMQQQQTEENSQFQQINDMENTNNMNEYDDIKANKTDIRAAKKLERKRMASKIAELQRFSFQVFLNQIETLFRLAQMAQDVSRKTFSLANDKKFQKFGDDLMNFVRGLRKGVAVKRTLSSISRKLGSSVLASPQLMSPQVVQRQDIKQLSYMEPLALRFEKEKNQIQNPPLIEGQVFDLGFEQSNNGNNGHMSTSVNADEKKKNKFERYMEMHEYAPLNNNQIEPIFMRIFPNSSKETCLQFINIIKNDRFLSFFESEESIEKYLENISSEYQNEHEAALQTLKKIYLLKEDSLQHHWRNLKQLFDHYLQFHQTIKTKITSLLQGASASLRILLRNKIVLKEESKALKDYHSRVIEKLEKFNDEEVPLAEPITAYKAVNLKDLEETAKERANPDDIKKIIFKLADAGDPLKSKNNLYQGNNMMKQKRNNPTQQDPTENEVMNLLDTDIKKQLLFQNLNEDEYIQFENKQVKREATDLKKEENHGFAAVEAGKNNQADIYTTKQNLSQQYLKSFVNSDKVVWKLKQLENKKDNKFKSAAHLDDYLPKKAQTLQETEQLLSRLEKRHKKLPSILDSHNNSSPQITRDAILIQKYSLQNKITSQLSKQISLISPSLNRSKRILSPLGRKLLQNSFSTMATLPSRNSNIIMTTQSLKDTSVDIQRAAKIDRKEEIIRHSQQKYYQQLQEKAKLPSIELAQNQKKSSKDILGRILKETNCNNQSNINF